MPMDKDPNHGGTNADGTRNNHYCSLCYEQGAFKDDFSKADEMVAFVKGKLKEMGYGPLLRWFYTSHISRLERWNTGSS